MQLNFWRICVSHGNIVKFITSREDIDRYAKYTPLHSLQGPKMEYTKKAWLGHAETSPGA